ncbi:5''-nucleotidase/2'',3''-cyclic phosphodiesterase [Neocallimastix lanati (nom. inval.)]|jgi:2',3'-cyclic-nucleotide 2'-phosphodiesterase (5'-nucleotidase family)|nr:5''-nucleotidase/2'',3''-cyclic phosphodiesterase [Neocallimastix sp. JGI-2020a]
MKFLFFFLTLLSLFFIYSFEKTPDEDIIILYTNDVHCGINESIGYAGLSYYRDKVVSKKTPYVALVDAGDHVQGGTIGSISKGKYIMDIMNAMNYDVVTPGNHEFDYGMEQFQYFAKNLSCSYISCNFRSSETGNLILEPYKILEFGEVKVAFVGISTPDSIAKSVPSAFMNKEGDFIFSFDGGNAGEKLRTSVQKAVNDARAEGADYVIAVGHLGEKGDITKEWSSPDIVKHTNGIDAFIDGHTHEVTPSLILQNKEGKFVPITQSGSKLNYIGQVTIGKDGQIKTELIGPDQVTFRDERIYKLIEKIELNYKEKLNEKIGEVRFDLNILDKDGNRLIRKNETNLTNLITDALLIESKNYGGADIALCNGGNIRASIRAGDITYGDILKVLPFTNGACIVEMPGQAILDALEMSVRKYPESNGGFLHTAGLTYTFNPNIPSSVELDDKNMFIAVSGERRVNNVLINGEPIDLEKRYKVIADSYILLERGDGFIFEGLTEINLNFALPNELFINYIKKLSIDDMEKYRKPQGRIIYNDMER